MSAFKKHLKLKNQLNREIEAELKKVEEVAKRDPTLRIFVKTIRMTGILGIIKIMAYLTNGHKAQISSVVQRNTILPTTLSSRRAFLTKCPSLLHFSVCSYTRSSPFKISKCGVMDSIRICESFDPGSILGRLLLFNFFSLM